MAEAELWRRRSWRQRQRSWQRRRPELAGAERPELAEAELATGKRTTELAARAWSPWIRSPSLHRKASFVLKQLETVWKKSLAPANGLENVLTQ